LPAYTALTDFNLKNINHVNEKYHKCYTYWFHNNCLFICTVDAKYIKPFMVHFLKHFEIYTLSLFIKHRNDVFWYE